MSKFDVDDEGLARILERRGKAWAVAELVQNAWDAPDASRVAVAIEPIEGRPLARFRVEDDSPAGFADLAHGYTLFAPSAKAGDARLRGRFNIGEKLALAGCPEARIETTAGTIEFEAGVRRVFPRRKRGAGTCVSGIMPMTRAELEAVQAKVQTYIAPAGVVTFFNGAPLPARAPALTFETMLPSEAADEAGVLRPTRRRTTVELYEPLAGETAALYELGLPIVEIGDRWHVNVGQKVPMPFERDNVSAAWLRRLRVAVLEAAQGLLRPEDAAAPWLKEATGDPRCSRQALAAYRTLAFGESSVLADRRDAEAGVRAALHGAAVIPPNALTPGQRRNLLDAGLLRRAGDVYPTPRPFRAGGDPVVHVTPTPAMAAFAGFVAELGRRLLGRPVRTIFVERLDDGCIACFGHDCLHFAVVPLGGPGWFEGPLRGRQIDLLIHELGHGFAGNHLSEDYYRALTRLGGAAVALALREPAAFDLARYAEAAGPA